jgi:hypothetical protein
MGTLLLVALWLAVGYCLSYWLWDEPLLAILVGKKNYVDQMLIPLLFLYGIGFYGFIVFWPLLIPLKLISLWKQRSTR